MIRLAQAFSAGCILFAITAGAAEPGAADSKTQTGAAPALPAAGSAGAGKEGPASPAQGAVASDLEKGKQACSGLADQAREACEARAAATAESPRGRDGANPTGSGPVTPAAPGSGTLK